MWVFTRAQRVGLEIIVRVQMQIRLRTVKCGENHVVIKRMVF